MFLVSHHFASTLRMETLNLREPRPRMECQDWVQCAPVIRKEGMLLAPWFWERYGEICKIRVATIADCLSNVNLAMADGGFPLLIQYRGLILPSPVAKTLRDMSQCFQVLFRKKKQVTSNFHRKLKTMMLTHWVMDSGPTSNCAVQCLHPTAEHIPNHSIQRSIRTPCPYAICLRFVVLVFKYSQKRHTDTRWCQQALLQGCSQPSWMWFQRRSARRAS